MRVNEFIKRRSEFLRKDRIFNGVYMAIFFAILIGNIFFAAQVPDSWSIAYLIAFFAFLFANVWFSIWIGRKRARESGLNCKSCKSTLLGVPGDLAITTGQCCHCGGQAFDQ